MAFKKMWMMLGALVLGTAVGQDLTASDTRNIENERQELTSQISSVTKNSPLSLANVRTVSSVSTGGLQFHSSHFSHRSHSSHFSHRSSF